MASDYTIGMDIGTTQGKLGLLDGGGRWLGGYRDGYPTQRPRPGHVEQNPADWTDMLDAGLASLAATAEVPLAEVAAIGLCSQVNTHVFVDAAGTPLAPAITWQDTRASAEAAELNARVTDAQRLAWWGAPMPIDASHPLSRMLWMARHRPEVWDRTAHVLLPKDYCIRHLTGILATDPLSNIGLVDTALALVPEVLSLVPGAAERIAPLVGVTDIVGTVTHGPARGVPVAACTMDAWTGLLGAGGATEGATTYLSGTSEIVSVTSRPVTPTPGVIVFAECGGLRVHVGPTQAGGAAQLWFAGLTGLTPETMALAAGDRSRPSPLFVPHLMGERAPIWTPDARGMFLGLDEGMTTGDLARGVYEGVAFSARHVLDAVSASAGVHGGTITCGGGGFKSDLWNQIRADVLGRPLARVAVADPGIAGAAGLAAVAVGLAPTLAQAFAQITHVDRTYDPDPGRSAHYDDRYAIYLEAIAANADLNRRLIAD